MSCVLVANFGICRSAVVASLRIWQMLTLQRPMGHESLWGPSGFKGRRRPSRVRRQAVMHSTVMKA